MTEEMREMDGKKRWGKLARKQTPPDKTAWDQG